MEIGAMVIVALALQVAGCAEKAHSVDRVTMQPVWGRRVVRPTDATGLVPLEVWSEWSGSRADKPGRVSPGVMIGWIFILKLDGNTVSLASVGCPNVRPYGYRFSVPPLPPSFFAGEVRGSEVKTLKEGKLTGVRLNFTPRLSIYDKGGLHNVDLIKLTWTLDAMADGLGGIEIQEPVGTPDWTTGSDDGIRVKFGTSGDWPLR
jgi:hypothetical protein